MGQSLFRDVKTGNVGGVRKCLESLSKKGGELCDINAHDLDGLALVHYAAKMNHGEVRRIAVRYKACVDVNRF